MKHQFSSPGRWSRKALLGLALAAAGALGACDSLLDVENPQAIDPEQLNEPFYLGLLTNGVVGDFQRAFDDVVLFSGVFSDELRNHATFEEEPRIDQRDVTSGNGTAALVYTQLQRTRGLADSTASRFRTLRGDSANSDLRLARVQAYGGMTYVLMAEVLCEAPVNLSRPYTPTELLDSFAIPRFEDAIRVATAARAAAAAANPVGTRTIAGADSIINLARVGAARASLNLLGLTKNERHRQRAIDFATPVPAGFLFLSYYSEPAAELNNFVWSRLTNSISASVSNTPFEALRGLEPRVPIPTTLETATGGLRVYVPNSPAAYSTYRDSLPGAEFSKESHIRIASGLEARYIRAEAEGATPENIAFIESRRVIGRDTVGAGATVRTTAANFLSNLRDQRRRDFYLDGHRLGDLRRYRSQYGDIEDFNEFQQGLYPGSTTISYADQYCFPVNLAEVNGNPFY
ncbi:MAG: hypothetical protein AVDCRST_MAG68-2572 [uncultured Gemmatimonadetes bacterium]|uniref:RagB/SusD family nutrient uptake outer membrane protein n=1 Tax=uncultured Gemmatimonadota bacterium TaxID=203437 RepID=A0A6J4LJE8_9BACT|nr:MAG: hypothetical protein AVDCRST_MAG68-2572 [uncultured Gemmatimonadota bacterium]